jgi:hypothetical protein
VGKVITIASEAGGWHLFIPKQVIAASFGLAMSLLPGQINAWLGGAGDMTQALDDLLGR